MKKNDRLKQSQSILDLIANNPELEIISNLQKALHEQGITLNPKINRAVTNLAKLKVQFLHYKNSREKRSLKNNLEIRINTIKKVTEQMKKDKGYFSLQSSIEYLNDQLFLALIENAGITHDLTIKNKPNDTLAFSFHLWGLRRLLEQGQIKKPVETLSVVLEKSGYLKGLTTQWKTTTINNKCSSAQIFINKSRQLGACHDPKYFGSWPQVSSLQFAESISGNCEKCKRVWQKVLFTIENESSLIHKSAMSLSKRLPSHKNNLLEIAHNSRNNMPIEDLLKKIPHSMQNLVTYLF